MNKLYSVHDHWTDINKKNDVDIESIDGVITGIKVNGEDYSGGITWESVYSGSIDPDGEVSPFTADVSLTMTATDSIKVVYDGVEYVLPKQVFNEKIYYGAEPASLPADIDFTNCPFLIQILPDTVRVYTETAGLHTLAISVPQSGGESDFSTAQVTVTEIPTIYGAFVSPNDEWTETNSARLPSDHGSGVHTLILYKGKAHITVEVPIGGSVTVSGNIEQYELVSNEFIVTGDCSIAPSV